VRPEQLVFLLNLAAVGCGIAAIWLAIAPCADAVAAACVAAIMLALLAAAIATLPSMTRRSSHRELVSARHTERIGLSVRDYPGLLPIAADIVGVLLAHLRKRSFFGRAGSWEPYGPTCVEFSGFPCGVPI
jgi:hypothetical protein